MLSAKQVDAAFPFYLVIDGNGRVVTAGSSVPRVCPTLKPRDRLDQHFVLEQPTGVTLDFESLRPHVHEAFALRARHGPLRLRGQLHVLLRPHRILLLGSPWITDFADLSSLGISLGDLPNHDSLADFLTLLQTQRTDLADARRLAAALEERASHLRRATERAEAADQAKSRFVAMVGHELRTPLNGLIGLTESLSEDDLPEPTRREYGRTVHHSAQSLVRILDDLLDLSRLEAGQFELSRELVDLRELVGDTARLFAGAASKKHLTLRAFVDEAVPTHAMGDGARLAQVLRNLVGNALKFTEQGGVEIRMSRRPAADTVLEWLWVEIADTGIGIDEDDAERLFLPYVQASSSTSRHFGGTGLGLAICRQLIERMGGRIGAQARPGGGSLFWFATPLERTATLTPEARLEALRAWVAEHRPHALVVDDSRINGIVAHRLLTKIGFEVTVVTRGRQALERCARQVFDAVLLDLHLPDLSGREVARTLAEERRPMVLGVTGDIDCNKPGFAAENFLDGVLPKPLSRAALGVALHGLLCEQAG